MTGIHINTPQQKDIIKEQPGALLHSCLTTLQVNVSLEHPPIVVIKQSFEIGPLIWGLLYGVNSWQVQVSRTSVRVSECTSTVPSCSFSALHFCMNCEKLYVHFLVCIPDQIKFVVSKAIGK